jgi:hypothetical protein
VFLGQSRFNENFRHKPNITSTQNAKVTKVLARCTPGQELGSPLESLAPWLSVPEDLLTHMAACQELLWTADKGTCYFV